MILNDATLKKVLLSQNYISAEEADKAQNAAEASHTPLLEQLLRDQLISRDLVGQALAEYLHIPFTDLSTKGVSDENRMLLPEPIAKKFRAVVVEMDDSTVTIATDNPEDFDQSVFMRVFPKKDIKITFAFPEDIDEIINKRTTSLTVRFAQILQKGLVAPTILDEILSDAMTYRASDIHFEPNDNDVRVRFRIDGQLQTVVTLAKENYNNLVRVIKLRAGLSIDEHSSAQDGAIRLTHQNQNADLRISIVPALDGEKIVIRLLSEYVKNLTATELGLSPQDQALVMKIARSPFGMILTVGPTGSGKSTTLYSLMKLLNRPEVNITTIEDPVEYKIPGVNHIQVNNKTDFTFAKGLRSIVRQDPNIILVGEIRDRETAEIAANAALTGHLVLSSFHANDAATAFPRLLDMGIEPFLLSSTLELVIGQRLVRRICDSCRASYEIKSADLKKILDSYDKYFSEKVLTLYHGKGCKTCNFTGFKGRIAVFELIFTTPELQSSILTSPSTQEVWKLAKEQGAHSMFEDGLTKVRSGHTTIEELLRVVSPAPENIYKKNE